MHQTWSRPHALPWQKYDIFAACLELIYLPQDLGISLIFEVDNIILLNKTVSGKTLTNTLITVTFESLEIGWSARNPPPVCETVPRVEIAKVCVQLYDLDYQNKIISGCARVIGKIEGFVIFKMKIGCFRLRMEDLIDESAQDVYLVQKEDEEYWKYCSSNRYINCGLNALLPIKCVHQSAGTSINWSFNEHSAA